jgi:hypothetical protein
MTQERKKPMRWIESWLTTYFFWRLYKHYSKQGWALVCKIPLLNIAFPDTSVQYFVCSFPRDDRVRLVGKLPPRSLVAYSALTVYDTQGVPVASLYDDEIKVNKDGKYDLRMGCDLKIPPSSSYYCIIMRLYMADPHSPLRADLTPSLLVMDSGSPCQQTLAEVSVKDMAKNSETVEEKVVGFLSRRTLPQFSGKQSFYAPASSEMASFFVNKNAVYMLAVPDSRSGVLCVTGERYAKIGRDHDIRFVGFMACNLESTATDSSIGWMALPINYRVWVAKSENDARRAGYKGNDPLLLWKRTNKFPVLVYREVRVDHRGLMSVTQQEDRKVEPLECKKIMGRFYPLVV